MTVALDMSSCVKRFNHSSQHVLDLEEWSVADRVMIIGCPEFDERFRISDWVYWASENQRMMLGTCKLGLGGYHQIQGRFSMFHRLV